MSVKISEIIKIVEEIAPLSLAEKWDNSGLQVGQGDWPVKKIVIALDPLLDVVEYACDIDADLLITHHPLIFKPLSKIDFSTPSGEIIKMSLENKLAIYSTHTNFDSAVGGLNEILAERIGLANIEVLNKSNVNKKCKVIFFVPEEHKDIVLEALFDSPAGHIENYTCCTFRNTGIGTFKPVEGAEPSEGNINDLSTVNEVKIETVIAESDLDLVVNKVKKCHPYESMAYDVFPLITKKTDTGLGRVGVLKDPLSLKQFALNIKNSLGLEHIKIAGSEELVVDRVALCTGSGSSLMKDFFKSGAQVYLSGDLHYHDARTVEEKQLGLIDVGHFASEIIIIEALQKQLHNICLKRKYDIEIIASPVEKDPFILL